MLHAKKYIAQGIARVISLGTAAMMASETLAGPLEDGIAAYERYDFSAARNALTPMAAQGSASAQSILGMMYLRGQGVPLNAMVLAGGFSGRQSRGPWPHKAI